MKSVSEILTQKNISYIPRGPDLLVKCMNPQHQDTNPSMRIDSTTGAYNCFSCGFSGSIYSLLNQKVNRKQVKKTSLLKLIDSMLAKSTHLSIPQQAQMMQDSYRGISSQTIKKFKCFKHNQKQFIGRVVVPITSIKGSIVGFCARHMDIGATPKYLNYPNNMVTPLFPIVKPIQNSVIIVQGLFDMMNLHDKGLTNAICAFGTRKVNQDKIQLLKIQGVQKIYLFLDGDQAGQQAAKQIKDRIQNMDIHCINICVPNRDPGELTAYEVIKLKEKLYD